MDLTGRAAVVTGAGRGLGRAYAAEPARPGTSVVVNDAEEPAAEETAVAYRAGGRDTDATAGAWRAAVGREPQTLGIPAPHDPTT